MPIIIIIIVYSCCVSCDSRNGDDLSSSCDSSVVTDTNGLQVSSHTIITVLYS